MAIRSGNRFTIYDAMEAKGVFAVNPANIDSRGKENETLYKGPVEFPKMLYHPTADTEVIVPGTWENVPGVGNKLVGEQHAIKHRVVNNADEETALLAQGWTDHPAKSIEQANKIRADQGLAPRPVPDMGAQITAQILGKQKSELEQMVAKLMAANEAQAAQLQKIMDAKGQVEEEPQAPSRFANKRP